MTLTVDKCGICSEYIELVARFNGYLICDYCQREINGATYVPPPPLPSIFVRSKDGIIDESETEN